MKTFTMIAMLLFSAVAANAQTIYSQNFEADSGGWGTLGGSCEWKYGTSATLSGATLLYTGNSGKFLGLNAQICGGVSAYCVTSPKINTIGYDSPLLKFDFYNGTDLLNWMGGAAGYLIVQYSHTAAAGCSGRVTFDSITVAANSWHNNYTVTLPAAASGDSLYITFFYSGPSNAGIDNILLTGSSSVAEASIETSMTVAPNPSNGMFVLNFGGTLSNSYDINVFNTMGQRVYAQKISNGVTSYNMDLSFLDNGVYFLQATTEGGFRTQERIVVSR